MEDTEQVSGAEFLTLVLDKRHQFSTEPEALTASGRAVLEQLELLYSTLESLPLDVLTPQYCQSVMRRNTALEATSLVKALQGREPVKASRQRHAAVHYCEECSGILADGVCTKCGHAMKVLEAPGVKGKSGSDNAEKMLQFEIDMNILFSIAPLPQDVCDKAPLIATLLAKKGVAVTLGSNIPTDTLRECFTEAKLNSFYIWCNAMRTHLTQWRPTPFTSEERAYLRECCQRAVTAFYKRMNRVDDHGHRAMANVWASQSVIKMIILSSPTLLMNHYDFFETLHTQNPATERIHCEVWNQMSREEKWVFK